MTAILDCVTVFIKKAVMISLHIAPYWICGIATGAAIIQVFSVEKIKKSRFLYGFTGIFAGAFLGVVSPVGLYGALPISGALAAAGIPVSTIFSYLISTPLINPNLFIYTAGVFGYQMAFARLAGAIALGISSGFIIWFLGRVKKDQLIVPQSFVVSKTNTDGICSSRMKKRGFVTEFIHFLRFSSPYFFLAIIISVVIEMFVPQTIVRNMLGSKNPFSVVFAAGLSIPLYLCGGNTVPFIHELVNAGMNHGAALAFFIAGPATKISNITFLSSILGVRGIIFFLTITLSASIAIGYFYGYLF